MFSMQRCISVAVSRCSTHGGGTAGGASVRLLSGPREAESEGMLANWFACQRARNVVSFSHARHLCVRVRVTVTAAVSPTAARTARGHGQGDFTGCSAAEDAAEHGW